MPVSSFTPRGFFHHSQHSFVPQACSAVESGARVTHRKDCPEARTKSRRSSERGQGIEDHRAGAEARVRCPMLPGRREGLIFPHDSAPQWQRPPKTKLLKASPTKFWPLRLFKDQIHLIPPFSAGPAPPTKAPPLPLCPISCSKPPARCILPLPYGLWALGTVLPAAATLGSASKRVLPAFPGACLALTGSRAQAGFIGLRGSQSAGK